MSLLETRVERLGPETLKERAFLDDYCVKLFAAARTWSTGAAGGRVWEICEILRPFETQVEAALRTAAPWDSQAQRDVRSTLLSLERFGRLYAPAVFKLATAAVQNFDARLKIEQSDGFDPSR